MVGSFKGRGRPESDKVGETSEKASLIVRHPASVTELRYCDQESIPCAGTVPEFWVTRCEKFVWMLLGEDEEEEDEEGEEGEGEEEEEEEEEGECTMNGAGRCCVEVNVDTVVVVCVVPMPR